MKIQTVIAVRHMDTVEKVPMIVGAHEVDILKAKFGDGRIEVLPGDEGVPFVNIDPDNEFEHLEQKHGADSESKRSYVEMVSPRRQFASYLEQFAVPEDVKDEPEDAPAKRGRPRKDA